MKISTTLALTSLLVLGACGSEDEPISVSAPVGINLKAEDGDVKIDNVITVEKGITTESGNPWGAFISDVEDQLGGPPGDIRLEVLELSLAASSDGVTQLNEVFDGLVDVQFEMNDTANFFSVGSVEITTALEGRTATLTPSFDYGDYAATDFEKLMNGSFKVVLGAPAEAGFKARKAKAEIQLTFEFAAFE